MRSARLHKLFVFAGLASLPFAAASADADTLTGKYSGSLSMPVAIQSPVYSGGVPNSISTFKFNWDRSDLPAGPGVDNTIPDLFVGFCIELDQGVAGNTTTTYNVVAPSAVGLDATKSLMLSRLYGSFHDTLASANDVAAFQCSIYEIVYDGSNVNLSSGNFLVQDISITVKTAAQFMLAAAVNPASPTAQLVVLQSDTKQDQLVRVVPTPASAALGLLGGGLMIRRRRA